MPDEVRCSNDSNHVFTCDVFIDSDPEPDPMPAASNSAASTASASKGASSTPSTASTASASKAASSTPSAASTASASKAVSKGASSTPSVTNASSPLPVAATPQSARPALSPAVSALVQGYKPTILPPVDVPYLTSHALLACSGNEAAVLLIAGGTKGALAVISAFKAGLDISKCVVGEHNTTQATAGRAEAAEYCAASGGTVTSVVDNRTYCAVPQGNP